MAATPPSTEAVQMEFDRLKDLYYSIYQTMLKDDEYRGAALMAQKAEDAAKFPENQKRFKKLYDYARSQEDKFKKMKAEAEAAASSKKGWFNWGSSSDSKPSGGDKKDEDAPKDPIPEDVFDVAKGTYKRTFKDIIGMKREKQMIKQDFITPLKFPYTLEAQSNLLMYGPPGTGKSFIVKAIAAEIWKALGGHENITFNMYLATGAEIKGKYVGETEKNLKHHFEFAQKAAGSNGRSIIFMDEVDAIAGDRAGGDPMMTSSVNALLAILEGAGDGYPNVIFIAATNYPWRLDGAILRRFNTKIMLDLPGTGAIHNLVAMKLQDTKRIQPTNTAYLGEIVSMMTELMQVTERGLSRLVDALKRRGVSPDKVVEFLEKGDHVVHEFDYEFLEKSKFRYANFELGVSFSDVDKTMTTALNMIGMMVLNRENPKLKCCPIQSASCNRDQIQECGQLTDGEKRELRITTTDIVDNFKIMNNAVLAFGSSVRFDDYVDLVYYNITGEDPNTIVPQKSGDDDE